MWLRKKTYLSVTITLCTPWVLVMTSNEVVGPVALVVLGPIQMRKSH